MGQAISRCACITFVLCIAMSSMAQVQTREVEEQRSTQGITWRTGFGWESAHFAISGPCGDITWTVSTGSPMQLAVEDLEVWALLGETELNGQYNYEIRFAPVVDPATRAELDRLRADADGAGPVATLVSELPLVSGTFRIVEGAIVGTESDGTEMEAVTKDIIHNDDVIITNSLCVGFDCVNGESFGFDTIISKENNLRIFFNDTSSTSSFPTNNWRITINDSSNGGGSYFSIDDVDGGRSPFRVEAGTPNHSLYVGDYGRIGLGTSTPAVELHVKDSDTPTLRLEQDGSGGWAPQTWDVAGNESNFFIRDVNHGSQLPFRIQPGTPSSTLTLKAGGLVGIGTWSPESTLEIETTGADAELRLDRTDGGAWVMAAKQDQTFTIGLPDDGQTFLTLHSTGALKAAGAVNGLSDRNAKQDFETIDRAALLGRLAALDVSEWSYITEGPGIRHVGPTAQDFRAAFGLGDDDTHISLSDLSGIALAAIQELHQRLGQRDREIAELRARLEALERNLQ
jgi:hypothetical protein